MSEANEIPEARTLRAAYAASTPDEWLVRPASIGASMLLRIGSAQPLLITPPADAAFIVAAHANVPAVLDALEASERREVALTGDLAEARLALAVAVYDRALLDEIADASAAVERIEWSIATGPLPNIEALLAARNRLRSALRRKAALEGKETP